MGLNAEAFALPAEQVAAFINRHLSSTGRRLEQKNPVYFLYGFQCNLHVAKTCHFYGVNGYNFEIARDTWSFQMHPMLTLSKPPSYVLLGAVSF